MQGIAKIFYKILQRTGECAILVKTGKMEGVVMKYTNPVLKGFYPDPSVCCVNGIYYMVCSSFQYFPGVPLFESADLVNWRQIGHVLTRKSQVMLDQINSSGGVFAATIRYHEGRFYVTTTNNTTQQNFYVWTEDIHGEWSETVYVEQDGIDPSFYFEDGRTYFMSTGRDDFGESGIIQSEIDLETGRKLTPSRSVWKGTGGRFVEGPHLYKLGEWYYLFASEGGTEYGHMITLCRGKTPWGPFENCPRNPVLTNRNKAPYIIQAIGHGDLVPGPDGNWYMVSLGFRQIDTWMPFHHLGREVFLTPVAQTAEGWFRCGSDGTTDLTYEVPIGGAQQEKKLWTMENTDWNVDWCFLRHPNMENYVLGEDKAVLKGTAVTLDEVASPTFVGLRQRDFDGRLTCHVKADRGEAGLTAYMCEEEHYDLGIRKTDRGWEAFVRLCVGNIRHIQASVPLESGEAELEISFDALQYHFHVTQKGEKRHLADGQTRLLSTEVATGFTGVVLGLYAAGENEAVFSEFSCEYQP